MWIYFTYAKSFHIELLTIKLFLGKNIKYLRSKNRLSQQQLADIVGVERTSVTGWESEKGSPAHGTFLKLASYFKVNLNDIVYSDLSKELTSENAHLNAHPNAHLSTTDVHPFVNPSVHPTTKNVDVTVDPSVVPIKREIQPVVLTIDHKGKENIVFVDVKAAAGYATHFADREYFRQLPTFSLPGKRYQSGTFRCFEVEGDSMRGSLRPGEWVISRYIDDFTQIRDNFVYVVITQEGVIVKRVLNRIKERGRLVFKSDNPAYPLFELEPDQVREIWLGVGKFVFDLSNQELDIHRNMDSFQLELMDLRYRMDKLEGKDALPPPQKK